MKREEFHCSKADCTFAITGTCLESIDDPTCNCPYLKADDIASAARDDSGPVDESEVRRDCVRQFASGLELGMRDVARLMRSRYTTLVGVLGQVEAGKTCLFTSIYLQVTGRYLCPRYRFVKSETLLGFEQRARHLRDWSLGGVPDQIVDHTQLGHSRSPAFLHLALRDELGVRHDLLFPDLPGEWTTRLLSEASTAERFAFLARSDIMLLVLEAPKFANARTRNNAIADATHILARLRQDVRLPTFIPIVLAVTKCDETNGEVPADLSRIADVVSGHGYSVETVALAAFPAEATQFPTGFGIDTLIARLVSPSVGRDSFSVATVDATDRSYLKAQGHR